jgi:hypothetical protein
MTPPARNLSSLFDAFSSREPVPISLENAIPQQTVDGLQGALEILTRSSYVPNSPIGVQSPGSGDARLNAARSTRLECRDG